MATNTSGTSELVHSLEVINKSSFSDDESRAQAAKAAQSLFNRLESPYERFQRYGYARPAHDAALTTCRNLDLFNKWPADLKESMTVAALAKSSGASEDVIRRTCKHLAAMEDLIEAGEDQYCLTDYTASLKFPTRSSMIGHNAHKALRAVPEWLAKNNYQSPSNFKDCPFQVGVASEHTWWTWLEADKDAGERFNLTMQGMASEWKCAIDLYPVQEKLIDGFEGGALIVDVGGGIGHDLEPICEEYPVEGAEYILQDVQSVLDAAKPKEPIKKMAHDFFTEQPVQGARSFFLKQIMHDWPDEQAIDILVKLRPAMKAGYTKLLIHDIVVPPTGAPPYTTAIDIFMMALFGARERTQANWDTLIQAAGLKLEKVWSGPGYRESILEVVREA